MPYHFAKSWGAPPWGIDFQPHPPPLPAEVDFAIVGGGFTGLSCAAWLRCMAPHKSVAVLDAESVGAGASGRTGGMTLAESAAGDLPGLGDVLGRFAGILAELTIECELHLPGAWELGRSGGLPDSPISWRDSGNLRAVGEVPGGTVNPGKLVSGLARAAEGAGAAIYENARVEQVIFSPQPMLRIAWACADAGDVSGQFCGMPYSQLRAEKMLFASNAESLEISGLGLRAEPKLTLAAATAPLSEQQIQAIGLASERPFYTVDFPYLWGRLMPSRGVIFGAGLVPVDDSRSLAAIDVTMGEAGSLISRIERRVRHLHPALRNVEFTHRWGGPILFAEDMRPVFRWHPDSSSSLMLGAYAGHGVALSVYLGRWAAEVLLGCRDLPQW